MSIRTHSLILAAIALAFSLSAAPREDVPFNGLILDAALKPINKVKVYVNDPNYAARSDKQGRFGLTNILPTDTLTFEFPSKETARIPVAGRKSLKVILDLNNGPIATQDDDLVNTGYNYVKRREFTGSGSGLKGETLRRSGRTYLLEALSGMVAGLTVTSRDGRLVPNIRGMRSLTLSNEPLYIVDGSEVESLDNITVYDVEHVDILKEASRYGMRGANGAIIVTTTFSQSPKNNRHTF